MIPTTKDTSKIFIDSAKYYIVNKHHGMAFQLPFSNYETISKEEIVLERYNEMSDIISHRTSAYPLSLVVPVNSTVYLFLEGVRRIWL